MSRLSRSVADGDFVVESPPDIHHPPEQKQQERSDKGQLNC
jgi:hypothetical protein